MGNAAKNWERKPLEYFGLQNKRFRSLIVRAASSSSHAFLLGLSPSEFEEAVQVNGSWVKVGPGDLPEAQTLIPSSI